MTPLLASSMTEGEMLQAQADLGSRMAPLSTAAGAPSDQEVIVQRS
jgi:hypothetical protein